MPLTKDQLLARRSKVGSSDAAAILGVDPYRTPRDVWMEKTGRVEVAQLYNEAIRIGNEAEPMLLRMLAQDQMLDENALVTGITFTHEDGINASNPDGIIAPDRQDPLDKYRPTEIVEAKSTGLEGWGDDADVVNDVPPKVLIQIHHQFYCTGAVVCYVPVLIGRFGLKFRVYRVERDEDLANTIGGRCRTWWEQHVVANVEPSGELHLDIAKLIKRTEGKSIPVSKMLVQDWQTARDTRLAAEKVEKSNLADLLAVLGDAEVGECDLGKFTFRMQKRKGYVVKESAFRVARFSKAK